jgi:hypothetical protein
VLLVDRLRASTTMASDVGILGDHGSGGSVESGGSDDRSRGGVELSGRTIALIGMHYFSTIVIGPIEYS